jgi:hypothetical protein
MPETHEEPLGFEHVGVHASLHHTPIACEFASLAMLDLHWVLMWMVVVLSVGKIMAMVWETFIRRSGRVDGKIMTLGRQVAVFQLSLTFTTVLERVPCSACFRAG